MLTGTDSSGRPKVGEFNIELYLSEHGVITSFGYDGMTKEAAIGHLQVVLDRLRKERESEWDTCPCCREPWSSHVEDDAEDGYDLEEDDE